LSDSLVKALKIFVVVAGLLIVVGTTALVWVIVQGGRNVASLPSRTATTLALPDAARIEQSLAAGNQLVLLGTVPDNRRFLVIIDLTSGRRRHLLWLVPETP
jgi:hypothetical protein